MCKLKIPALASSIRLTTMTKKNLNKNWICICKIVDRVHKMQRMHRLIGMHACRIAAEHFAHTCSWIVQWIAWSWNFLWTPQLIYIYIYIYWTIIANRTYFGRIVDAATLLNSRIINSNVSTSMTWMRMCMIRRIEDQPNIFGPEIISTKSVVY